LKLQQEAETQKIVAQLQTAQLELTKNRAEFSSELKFKVESLERQVQDKDELLNKMSALLEISKQQKVPSYLKALNN
jgi:paraquat-inducible protein B